MQHIVVLSIDSGDPSLTDFHHGLLRLPQTWPTKTRRKIRRIPRMAHDQALAKVMQHLLKDDTQVYKQFVENESFKRFVGDMVYAITSQQ
jgi:hypothetical protein